MRTRVSSGISVDGSETLSEGAVFAIRSQVNRVFLGNGARGFAAAVTWMRGTNIFFTNEHVAKLACDSKGLCSFEEKQSFNVLPRIRRFQKKECFLGQDLCALLPADEEFPILGQYQTATASLGQVVYYVDVRSKDFQIIKGSIVEKSSDTFTLRGFVRHGFSGSAVFDSEGQILGLIRSLGSSIMVVFPHYLLFGWAADNSIKVSRLPSLEMIGIGQESLFKRDWETRLARFQANYRFHDACSSSWSSWRVVFNFIILGVTSENPMAHKHFDNLIDGFDIDPSAQKLCMALLDLGEKR